MKMTLFYISKLQKIWNDISINTMIQKIVHIFGEHTLGEHLGEEILTFK